MNKERRNIIKRLEKCRRVHQEFYKNHPDMLEEITYKINALKNGTEYEVKDAGWVVGYVGGKIRETNFKYNNGRYVKVEYGHYEVDELLQILDYKVFAYQWFENNQLLVLSI